MTTVIEVQGLTRRFGDLLAVDHVDFVVETGEIFGFLGPNGAGKTTTVRMLTGVIEPTEGTATIQGHDIVKAPSSSREHLGIVPEEANVYLDLSVWQNLMFIAELYGISRRRRIGEGERLLEIFGLAERKHHKARTLSKGLRQRLVLCSALVSGPEILFLDEPTIGLDVHSTRLIQKVVSDMNRQGMTVFLTTHDMDEAEEMCDRVAIINQGKIAAIDTPDQLQELVRVSQYVEVSFEGSEPQEADLASLPEVDRVTRKGGHYRLYTDMPGRTAVGLGLFADRNGLTVRDLCTRKPSLEDIFLHLTEGRGKEGM